MRPTRDHARRALKEIDEARQALSALYMLLTIPEENRDESTQAIGCLAKVIAARIIDPWIVLHDWFYADDDEAAEDATHDT